MSASSIVPIIDYLSSFEGTYSGSGTNYEGQPFTCTLSLGSRVQTSLVELRFRAEDADSAFHEEVTWISNDLMQDRIAIWTVSSNTPGVLKLDLVQDSPQDGTRERRLVFRLGEPSNRHSFRQEITIDLMKDRTLEYRYAWGVPHEEFAARTRACLAPVKC